MFYTVVVFYKEGVSAYLTLLDYEEIANLQATAEAMSPDFPSVLTNAIAVDDSERLSVRSWPTLEIATAWIAYVRENFNIVSAEVITEPFDFTNYIVQ
jgi:hypothetical protein